METNERCTGRVAVPNAPKMFVQRPGNWSATPIFTGEPEDRRCTAPTGHLDHCQWVEHHAPNWDGTPHEEPAAR